MQGHTPIGLLNGSIALQTARDRLNAYTAALRDAAGYRAGLPQAQRLAQPFQTVGDVNQAVEVNSTARQLLQTKLQ